MKDTSSITVHMLARNSRGLALFCLLPFLSKVTKVLVDVDSSSTDNTYQELKVFEKVYPNLEVTWSRVVTPLVDLVRIRNEQIKRTDTDWIWIVDSDELYLSDTIDTIKNQIGDDDAYSLMFWAVWDRHNLHKSTSKRQTLRIVRNKPDLRWKRKFGKEYLCYGDARIEPKPLPYRYIHFTHIKRDNWRSELSQQRTVDGKFLSPMPEEIKGIINEIYEKKENLPSLRLE